GSLVRAAAAACQQDGGGQRDGQVQATTSPATATRESRHDHSMLSPQAWRSITTPRRVALASTALVMSSTGSVVTATAGRPCSPTTSAPAAANPGATIAATTTLPSSLVGNVLANQKPAAPGAAN